MTPSSFAARTNDYLTAYIAFADTKAGATLTFTSILGAGVGFAAPKVLHAARSASDFTYCVGAVTAAVVGASVAGALWCCLEALAPRVEPGADSLHSFPHLAIMQASVLQQRVSVLDETQAAIELSSHNATLARVAAAKFEQLRTATKCLRVALLSSFVVAVFFCVVSMGEVPNG